MLTRKDMTWATLKRGPSRAGGAEFEAAAPSMAFTICRRLIIVSSATFPSLGNRHHVTGHAGGITGRRTVSRRAWLSWHAVWDKM